MKLTQILFPIFGKTINPFLGNYITHFRDNLSRFSGMIPFFREYIPEKDVSNRDINRNINRDKQKKYKKEIWRRTPNIFLN